MKSCSVPDCIFPSFGKDKNTGLPYCSSHQYLRTDIDRRSLLEKHMDKMKSVNKKASVKTSVRSLINSTQNKVVKQKSEIRSEMLMLADKLFGNFIKKRDADENGFITCPCCKQTFNLEDKYVDATGKETKIIQPLHFVDRGVYSLRFEEMNCFAGCGFCNKKQHDSPTGITYQQYKEFIIAKFGKDVVANMEEEKRNINKLTHSDIQSVIEKYKP